MSKAVKIGAGVLGGFLVVSMVNSLVGYHSGRTPTPAESAQQKKLHDEAMGTGSPTPYVPDDMPVAFRQSGDGSRWIPVTAGQEKTIASTREQCEVLLQRFRKLPNTRLPYGGKTFEALCESMPSKPGSAKPADGWGS